MIRQICDGCGKEIDRNYVSKSFEPVHEFTWIDSKSNTQRTVVELTVMVSINGEVNEGELCLDCLRRVFQEGQEKEEEGDDQEEDERGQASRPQRGQQHRRR